MIHNLLRSKLQPEILPGTVYSNGAQMVRVMTNAGDRSGWRLDQFPTNGLVYAPWFVDGRAVAEFLNAGGHCQGTPFRPVAH